MPEHFALGIAAAIVIAVAAIGGAIWSIDAHFITRREFNLFCENLRNELQGIKDKL